MTEGDGMPISDEKLWAVIGQSVWSDIRSAQEAIWGKMY